MKHWLLLFTFTILISSSFGVGVFVCFAACNSAAVACYAAAGLVIGTVTLGAGAPPAAIACSAVQSACMIACGAGGVATGGICTII